jgi:hypothetical protein
MDMPSIAARAFEPAMALQNGLRLDPPELHPLLVNSINRSQAAKMSASHARGSRGIDELSGLVDSPTQLRVAYRAHLNQIDGACTGNVRILTGARLR